MLDAKPLVHKIADLKVKFHKIGLSNYYKTVTVSKSQKMNMRPFLFTCFSALK